MSKPVKKMIIDMYQQQFADIDGALLIDIRGVDANTNRDLRASFAKSEVRITVVKNALARHAFTGTELEPLNEMIDGPTAVVTGGESVVTVARELIDWAKKIEDLEVKGAIMEGVVFGPDDIETLSKYPTREEAQAQLIQVVIGPAGAVIGAATSAGSNIASILSAIEEKLEKGEVIEKVG